MDDNASLVLAGAIIGMVSVASLVFIYGFLLSRELLRIRVFRKHGGLDGDETRVFTLRRSIRFLCFLWAMLEIPLYASTMESAIGNVNDGVNAWCYACHLVAQAAVYSAFCGFMVLWLMILRFGQKPIQCVTIVSGILGGGYTVATLFLCYAVISANTMPLDSIPIYKYFYIIIPVALMSISFLFLGYGAYLQVVLHSWYRKNTGWQRSVLVKLNSIVCTLTMACLLRATMVLLLMFETTYHAWQFFTDGGANANPHPVIWTLAAQVIPFSTLSGVLFYMSRPSGHGEVRTTAEGSSVQEKDPPPAFMPFPGSGDGLEYDIASPSYSQSYFTSNPTGYHREESPESVKDGAARSCGHSFEVEARAQSVPVEHRAGLERPRVVSQPDSRSIMTALADRLIPSSS